MRLKTPSLRRSGSAPCHSSALSSVRRQSWNAAAPSASISSVTIAPHQRLGAIAQRLRRKRVQRGQPALHRAGKDKSQAVLHHLAIAGLARQQRLLHLALVGHVLPAHNQVLNLAIRSLERTQGPTHAPRPAARRLPRCFVRS